MVIITGRRVEDLAHVLLWTKPGGGGGGGGGGGLELELELVELP